MWVVGVVGREATGIADRIRRHVENIRGVVSDKSDGTMPLQTGIVSCVDQFLKITRQAARPNFLLIVVDPPSAGSPNFTPIANYSKHNPDYKWVPFWYQEVPSDDWDTFLSTESRFEEFESVFKKITNEPCNIQDEVRRSPVFTRSITKNISGLNETPVMFRSTASVEQKERNKLGKGHVMSFTAAKGGSGKSTLALIAASLMTPYALNYNQRVLLIEANLGQPVIGARIQQKPGKDLMIAVSDVEEGKDPLEALKKVILPIGQAEEGFIGVDAAFTVLQADKGTRIGRYSNILYSLVCAGAEMYDYVFVDMPPIDRTVREDLVDRFVLPISDTVVMVSDNDFSAAGNTFVFSKEILTPHEGAQFPREKMWFVLNKEGENQEFNMTEFKNVANSIHSSEQCQITSGIPYSQKLQNLLNAGESIITHTSAEVSSAVGTMLEEILGLSEGSITGNTPKKKKSGFFGKKK